jgi:hypothetical protein
MRKLMSTMLAGAILFGLTMGITGCTEESGTKEVITTKAPDGSKTTESREINVKKSGDNAPAAPSEKP